MKMVESIEEFRRTVEDGLAQAHQRQREARTARSIEYATSSEVTARLSEINTRLYEALDIRYEHFEN